MSKNLFVAATGQHSGKTTVALSIFHLLKKAGASVGFVKPVGQVYRHYHGFDVDKDAAMMAEVFDFDPEDIPYISPVVIKPGLTQEILDGKITQAQLVQPIKEAREFMESKYDYLIIEGTGHVAVGAVIGINNGDSARLFDASVLLVNGGGIGNVIDRVHSNDLVLKDAGVKLSAVMPNKLFAEKKEKVLFYLRKAQGKGRSP